jgi:hypothetical protein
MSEASKYHESVIKADVLWYIKDAPYRQDMIKNIEAGDYTNTIQYLISCAENGNGIVKSEAKKHLRAIYAMIDNGILIDDIISASEFSAVEKMPVKKLDELLESVLDTYLAKLPPEILAIKMKKIVNSADIERLLQELSQ